MKKYILLASLFLILLSCDDGVYTIDGLGKVEVITTVNVIDKEEQRIDSIYNALCDSIDSTPKVNMLKVYTNGGETKVCALFNYEGNDVYYGGEIRHLVSTYMTLDTLNVKDINFPSQHHSDTIV